MIYQFLGITLFVMVAVYSFTFALVFFHTKQIYLLTPYDVVDVLRDPAFFAHISTVIAVLSALLLLYLYVKSEYKKYQHLRENRIYAISLKELAQIWGAGRVDTPIKETIPVVYLKNFIQDRTRDFVVKYMEKNMRFFPQEKLEIIFELLKILETEAVLIPSVASKFRSDPEKQGSFQAIITSDGKTMYDVFHDVTLFNHTMNVVEKAIEFLKDKDPISFETSMCDGIIVALAHDIGKLHKISQFKKEYPNEILTQNPHQAISKMFFGEMWAGYVSIEEAIYNHHSAPNSTSLLTRMIIYADKEARKAEMLEWQRRRNEEKRTFADTQTLLEHITVPVLDNDHQVNLGSKEPETPAVNVAKKSRTKERNMAKVQHQENIAKDDIKSDNAEKSYIISVPIAHEDSNQPRYDTPESIDFNDDLEAKIIAELRANINIYTLEKPQGIHSISYNDTVLFSVTFYNSIIKKYIYVNGEDDKLIKKIGMYISAQFYSKGYVRYMHKDAGCSTFFLTINQKQYKYMCVPFKAEVFNTSAYELDLKKDTWLKSISISEYRVGVQS